MAWPLFKEWTLLTQITTGTGLPETPAYPFTVPGTGVVGPLRPSLTGAPIYASNGITHLNAAAYNAPVPGLFGTAGRNSITGPAQFRSRRRNSAHLSPHVSLLSRRANRRNQPDESRGVHKLEHDGRQHAVRPATFNQSDAQSASHIQAEVLIMRRVLAAFLALVFAVTASAQQIGQNKPAGANRTTSRSQSKCSWWSRSWL